MMFRLFLLSLFALIISSVAAVAADEVQVRVGDQGDRVRLVIEWPHEPLPLYHVRQIDDQTTEVTFAGTASGSSYSPVPMIPEIVDVRRVSDPGAPLRLWVIQSSKLFKREVSVGRRIILDFGHDEKLRAQKNQTDLPSEKKVDQIEDKENYKIKKEPQVELKKQDVLKPEQEVNKAGVATLSVQPTDKKSGLTPEIKPEIQVVSATSKLPAMMPDLDDRPIVVDKIQPPLLAISSLNKFGMASFIKNRTLWVVVDTPNFEGAPKLSGVGSERFGPVTRIGTSDATIFKWKLPGPVLFIRGEGGDLFWRVVIAPVDSKLLPATDLRRLDGDNDRGVLWPSDVTKLIKLNDPDTGETIVVGTVSKSDQYAGPMHDFTEFYTAHSPIGIAVVSKVDDLDVKIIHDGVLISRPSGVSVTTSLQAETYVSEDDHKGDPTLTAPPTRHESDHEVKAIVSSDAENSDDSKIIDATGAQKNILYRFDRWAMGGVSSLLSNEAALISDLSEKKEDDRASGYMNIGKMFLASGRGAEAVGYFRLALESSPPLIDNPEFLGVRGAAYAINGQYDLAIDDLNNPGLDAYVDIPLWRAVMIGKLQDWSRAATVPEVDTKLAAHYPWSFGPDMILTIGESVLRAGKSIEAQKILSTADNAMSDKKTQKLDNPLHRLSVLAYADYLKGEVARQQGKKDVAASIWEKLSKSKDDKYRARARLALAIMNFESGKITPDQAVDRLETLRFSWRGDDFEMAIGTRLGETYLAGGDYIRGLSMLRDTVSLAPESESGRRVTALMIEQFKSVFTPENIKKIDPIDAITVFEKFGELAPVGVDANQMMMNLVDRLLEVDLLDRAVRVLQDLVDHKLVDNERVDGALRLAAVHLMNKRADLALGVLNRTDAMIEVLPKDDLQKRKLLDLGLLRARALSQSDRVDQALSVLSELPQDDPNVLRAGADIAWQTARWGDVAAALSKLLALDPILPTKPPTDIQADNVQNLAVAVNLGGDRIELARIRSLYMTAMTQTKRADEFDIVTRERQVPTLADRDTLNKLVEEVDLFGKFLDSFRKTSPLLPKSTGGGLVSLPAAAVTDGPLADPAAKVTPPKTVAGE